MDLGNPLALASGLMLGVVGMALLVYGKKAQRLAPIVAGIAVSAIPYFVASIILGWLLAAACMGGLYWHAKRF